MGIESYDYLVVPRVAGVMIATAALTCYIQFLAVLGGMILSPFVIQASFEELYTKFFDLVAPVDFAYSIIKSLMFGFAIALTCCYHGLNPPAFTQNGVPQAVTRAVTQSAVAVLTINARVRLPGIRRAVLRPGQGGGVSALALRYDLKRGRPRAGQRRRYPAAARSACACPTRKPRRAWSPRC